MSTKSTRHLRRKAERAVHEWNRERSRWGRGVWQKGPAFKLEQGTYPAGKYEFFEGQPVLRRLVNAAPYRLPFTIVDEAGTP